MNRNRILLLLGSLAGLVLVSNTVGCSKDKTTNPPSGGGTPTLNLTLGTSGGTAAFTFNDAGTYLYMCGIHNGMTGEVVVAAASPNLHGYVTVGATPSPGVFNPQSVHIQPGGTVHWDNPTLTAHTVVNR